MLKPSFKKEEFYSYFNRYEETYKFYEFEYPDFSLKDGVFYYPCSGSDVVSPLIHFSSIIDDFWFVDIYYHRIGSSWKMRYKHEKQFDYKYHDKIIEQESLTKLFDLSESLSEFFTKIDQKLWIPSLTPYDPNRRGAWIDPLVLTETFKRNYDGKIIRTHLKRGFDLASLEKNDIEKISIFFYRGDSGGEGGSGVYILSKEKVPKILNKMLNGGLFITDGSNSSHVGVFSDRRNDVPNETEIYKSSFSVKFRWLCNIDRRYGPTRVWQVTKLDNSGLG